MNADAPNKENANSVNDTTAAAENPFFIFHHPNMRALMYGLIDAFSYSPLYSNEKNCQVINGRSAGRPNDSGCSIID